MIAKSAAADRNLLFGILAVQMDFVTAEQLLAAMSSWVLNKSKPLGAHLIDTAALSAETHDLIQALVDKHIEQHDGRVERSLAALSSLEPLRRQLQEIPDADVQASLIRAAQAPAVVDRHATVAVPRSHAADEESRFQILRPHASGGLGKVSIARDRELNREVALKELHDRHADNADSRARFVQEAEITGGLEHPGVVPIYGLGQYADGRPFYAMRFIRGDSLAEAIDRFHREADPAWAAAADVLQLRRLLSRFIDVCNAVEYAHSRGVLHRDLKPGNIMLGQYGETLVVDWGLAKPIGRGDSPGQGGGATALVSSEPTLRPQSGSGSAPTQMGSAIGTPAYMSPEQAAGRLDRLGPASDVYSLGATLYVLLAGQPPQQDDDLGIVLARVQRGEFQPPRAVKPVVPRALEAICLKAMALAPGERYVSARKLADDVEAWLADEPVTALPESIAVRAYRWVKRHRTLVTSGAAMIVVALLALAAGNVQLRVANQRERQSKNAAVAAQHNEREARLAAQSAQKKAELAQAEAERQTARNNALLNLARKSLERYETLSRADELKRYGMEKLRGDLLAAAVEFYATLAEQSGESESARADRGDALYRLGAAYWQLGRMADARQAYQQSFDLYHGLEQQFAGNAAYPNGAAQALAALGEMGANARDPEGAASPLAEARSRLQELHAARPDEVDAAARLAYIHSLEGERLRQLGQMNDAARTFGEGVDILRSIDLAALEADKSREIRYRLGRALSQLATLESQALWQFKPARAHYDEAVSLMRQLYREAPEVGDFGFSLAQILRNSGSLYAREFFGVEAKAAYEEGLAVLAEVERRQPDVPHYRQEMAELLRSLGTLHAPFETSNMTDAGLAQLQQAVAIGKQLVERFPEQIDRRLALSRYQSVLGQAYLARQRVDDATAIYSEAATSLGEVGEAAGKHVDVLYTLAEIQYTVAGQLAKSGRTDSALELLDRAEANLNHLIELAPNYGEAYLSLANVYIARSNALEGAGRLVDAVIELDRIASVSGKTGSMTAIPWMQSGMQTVAALAKTLRWGQIKRAREGALVELARQGQYETAHEQCRRLPRVTGAAGDHYIAAKALAAGAEAAQHNAKLAPEPRQAAVEQLASAAVDELRLAWEAGYLRRAAGFSGLVYSRPTLKTLAESPEFTPLRERADYRRLIERIQTEQPPREPAEASSAETSPAEQSSAEVEAAEDSP
ncbi:MAG: protein kinase [Pirellulales bacterium]|nr:protein kinase [Pirellulales bacterium]